METHSKVLGLTLDPKLTYSTYIHNISVQAHKPLHMIKALTSTRWGKQKEELKATYKAVMRPALEYAFSIWSLLASSTSITKLQVMHNVAELQQNCSRTATDAHKTQTYNICMTKHSYFPYTSTYSSTPQQGSWEWVLFCLYILKTLYLCFKHSSTVAKVILCITMFLNLMYLISHSPSQVFRECYCFDTSCHCVLVDPSEYHGNFSKL